MMGFRFTYILLEGVYVDLVENPEAFTGYAGPSAHQVWKAIYEENCFHYAPELRDLPTTGLVSPAVCTEKKIFYRILSGTLTLKSRISMLPYC